MTPSDRAAEPVTPMGIAEPATPMGIAEDHAALHALARLVAQGVDPEEVFVAVADQAAEVLGADIAAIDRFNPDDMVTLVAVRGAAGDVPDRARPRRPRDGAGRHPHPLRAGPLPHPPTESGFGLPINRWPRSPRSSTR